MNNVVLLGITSLLTDISSEMVYPLLPVFLVSQLGASPALLGVIEGFAESLASVLKVFAGYFSDRMKRRRPFTIAGYFCSTVGKVFLYAAGGWGQVLAGRLIDRFGKGVRTAPRDALIAESVVSSRGAGAAFGLHRAMDTLGACIGVALAFLLVTRFTGDLRVIFLISVIPALAGVGVLFLVREKASVPAAAPARELPRFAWKQLDPRLKGFLAFAFIFTLGNSSNQFLLLRARELGATLPQVILMYLGYNVIYSTVSYPAARLSDRIGRRALLVAGYAAYGLVYAGFALTSSLAAAWWLFAVYGLFMACTEGVEKALLAELAPPHLKATVMGTHGMLVGVGLLPASLLAGMLWKMYGSWAAFSVGAGMGLAASIGVACILRRETARR
jgi:MFS family permease